MFINSTTGGNVIELFSALMSIGQKYRHQGTQHNKLGVTTSGIMKISIVTFGIKILSKTPSKTIFSTTVVMMLLALWH
jgi:hypothetical protein